MNDTLRITLRPKGSLHGRIRLTRQSSGTLPVYTGPYTAEPSSQPITLFTAGKEMIGNISIPAISFREQKNTAGGWTAIIGG